MTTEQPRTYKYQLSTEDFTFAFTATDDEFRPREEEMRGKGVERLTGIEVKEKYSIHLSVDTKKNLFTYINEAEIGTAVNEVITFKNLTKPVPGLVLRLCSLPAVVIQNCALGRVTNGESSIAATSFTLTESITGYFHILQSDTGNFDIQESTTRQFSIRQSTTGNFDIQESTTSFFYVHQQSTTGNFEVRESTTGRFEVRESMTGNFSFVDSALPIFFGKELYCNFQIWNANIPQIRLINCHLPELDIGSGCITETYISGCTINLIDLRHLALSKESVVSLFNCTVYVCLMEELTVLGNLFFRQIEKLEKPFNWYNSKNKKTLIRATLGHVEMRQQHAKQYQDHLKRLKGEDDLKIKGPTFRIAQSSLGKTEFMDCDLESFRLEFNNAKITEVFMSGGTVPEDKIFICDEDNNEEKDALRREEQNVSVYNQLKKIFEGQGDIYLSTHFQSKTAEHQEKVLTIRRSKEKQDFKEDKPTLVGLLTLKRNAWQKLLNWFSTTFWDLITFKLNWISNRHGESWGQAFVFTSAVAAIFYLLFLGVIGRLLKNTAFDWDLAGKYFTYLDPTHKIDFIEHTKLNFAAYLIDFLSRIFVGYGIYQFISAFRKHGKK